MAGNMVSPRFMMILGGLFMGAAYVAGAFSPTFEITCFTLGPLLGLGMSFTHVLSTAYIHNMFYRYRGLATGMLFSGASAGSFVGPPLLRYLFEEYDLRGAQILIGGICLHVCVFAALMCPKSSFMRHPPPNSVSLKEVEVQPDEPDVAVSKNKVKETLLPFVTLLRDPWYLLYALGCMVSAQAMVTAFFLIPHYGEEVGITRQQTAWILFIQGFPDMFARSIMGGISDLPWVKLAFFAAFLTAGQAVSFLVAPFLPFFTGLLLFSVILAITGGPGGTMRVIVGGRLVESHLMPTMLGQTLLLQGLGWILIPRLFGTLRDTTGSWFSSFIVVAAFSLFASVVFLLLHIPLERRKKASLVEPE